MVADITIEQLREDIMDRLDSIETKIADDARWLRSIAGCFPKSQGRTDRARLRLSGGVYRSCELLDLAGLRHADFNTGEVTLVKPEDAEALLRANYGGAVLRELAKTLSTRANRPGTPASGKLGLNIAADLAISIADDLDTAASGTKETP